MADGLEGLLGERVCAFAVGAFLRFNLEAHLLDDSTADESAHAVGLHRIDRQRFNQINVALNWCEELKRRDPPPQYYPELDAPRHGR